MSKRGSQSQYWSFTYNLEKDVSLVSAESTNLEMVQLFDQLSWIIDAGFQLEKGLKSERYHIQGWIKLSKRNYKSYLLNSILNQGKLENAMHFEVARNPKALVDYCGKDDATKVGTYWCKTQFAELLEAQLKEEHLTSAFNEWQKEFDEFNFWRSNEAKLNGFYNNVCYCSEDEEAEPTLYPQCDCYKDPNQKNMFTIYAPSTV